MYFSGIFDNENISFPFPCSPVIRECSWKKPETEKKKKKKSTTQNIAAFDISLKLSFFI